MGWWTEKVVPHLTDAALAKPEVMALRADVCRGLSGEVVEIGFGSGLNLGVLPDQVRSVAAIEPNDLGWQRSSARRRDSTVPVTRSGLDGEALDAADASFDNALCTFTLCTVPDAARAIAELRRVLRPGGALHFLEHGLAPEPQVARMQRRLDPVQRIVFGGCNLSRDVPALLRAGGFAVNCQPIRIMPAKVMSPWAEGFLGRAVRD